MFCVYTVKYFQCIVEVLLRFKDMDDISTRLNSQIKWSVAGDCKWDIFSITVLR